MTQDDIRSIAQEVFDKNTVKDMFSVVDVQAHAHTGVDSNQVDFANVANRVHIIHEQIVGLTASTATNYTTFFTAPFPMTFTSANEVHTTAGSVGTPTVTVERLTGTTAPGSGTALLLTAFDMSAAINTVQYGTLANIVKSSFNLAKGDRLALVSSGTLTSIANVVVTITLTY